MYKNILSLSSGGLTITTDNANIAIDAPTNEHIPDALIFSNAQSFYSYIINTNDASDLPCYLTPKVKNVIGKVLNSDDCFFENTIECSGTKRIRKKHKLICEFAFYENPEKPDKSSVLINVSNKSILYINGEVPDIQALPHHDIMIINCNKKTPVYSFLKNLREFVVKVDDLSKICDVLSFFNNYGVENSVAIDNSILPAACEYLKLDYTVFSKNIKPLSFYNTQPKVIITTTPQLYANRPCIPDYAFSSGMSLKDIYFLAAHSDAKRIIAICPEICKSRTIKNLTLCAPDTIAEI